MRVEIQKGGEREKEKQARRDWKKESGEMKSKKQTERVQNNEDR